MSWYVLWLANDKELEAGQRNDDDAVHVAAPSLPANCFKACALCAINVEYGDLGWSRFCMYKCDPTRGVGFPGPFPSRQGVSAPSRQGVSAERERPLPAALADLLLGILNHGYAIPVLSYNPHELWGPRPFPASRKPTPLVTSLFSS